jgi:hypothetical protein
MMPVRIGLVFAVLLGIMLWPALYNGQPFFYPDTTAYIRTADVGVQSLTHHTTPWSAPAEDKRGGQDSTTNQSTKTASSVSSVNDKTVFAGRSPYYGILLYLGEITGGFWISIALQALAVLVAVAWTLRVLELPTWPHLLWIGIALATMTSASFFASFLMPDVFAALTILGCSVLIGVRRQLSAFDYLFCLLLLTASLTFHDTHPLIAAMLLLLALILNLLTRRWGNWRGLACIGSALLLAGCAQVIFEFAVQRVVGASPLRMPFLMARVIADGPGYRFLRDKCPGVGFEVCNYVDRLPMASDEFLWGSNGRPGVFADAPPQVRRELSAEQIPFALAVIAYDPIGQISAALRNIGLQLRDLSLWDFEYDENAKQVFEIKMPVEHLDPLRRSGAYRHTLPLGFMSGVVFVTFICSGAFSAYMLVSPRLRHGLTPEVASICAWAIVGILTNATICGALSGPNSRYAIRVAWILPLLALLLALTTVRKSAAKRAQSSIRSETF